MGANGRKTPKRTGIARAYQQQKREAAEARQVARDLRTTEEQLKLIDSRPGASRRERARLERSTQ